jgi:hypothetical protein
MGYRIQSLSQTITRPSVATTYASGQLIANSSLAASVTPLTFQVGSNFKLKSVTVSSNSTVIAQAQFKVHLYGSSPTVVNGDGGVWLTTNSNYIDNIPVNCNTNTFSSGTSIGISGLGYYTPTNLASSIPADLLLPYGTVYAHVTAAASWISASAQTINVTLNGEVNW